MRAMLGAVGTGLSLRWAPSVGGRGRGRALGALGLSSGRARGRDDVRSRHGGPEYEWRLVIRRGLSGRPETDGSGAEGGGGVGGLGDGPV